MYKRRDAGHTAECRGPGAPAGADTSVLRFMTAGDASEVIDMHWRFFPAASGRRFLERAYYPTLFDKGSTGFGFVEVRSAKVAGFLAGALDPMALHKTLVLSNFAECLGAAARVAVSGWSHSVQVLRSLRHLLSGTPIRKGAWIYFVAVDEGHRNQGVAERLIAAAVNYCRSRGRARCWIRTVKTNIAMQRVLKRIGFLIHPDARANAERRFLYFFDFGQGIRNESRR